MRSNHEAIGLMNNSRLRARVALPWRGSKKAAKERLPVIEALSRRSTKASHAPRHLLVVRTGAATPLLCLCAVALIRQATRAGGLSGLGGFPLFRWTRTTFKLRVQLTQAARPVLELAAALARRHRDARGNMAHAHSGIRGVHALAARTGRAKNLHLAVARDILQALRRPCGERLICRLFLVHIINLRNNL